MNNAQLMEAVGITLDSRIEELNLTRMTENTLKRAGCGTIRSLFEIAFQRRLRRFGEGARREVEAALQNRGIATPPAVVDREAKLMEIADRLEKLQRQVESDVRRWRQQMDSLDQLIRSLSQQLLNE